MTENSSDDSSVRAILPAVQSTPSLPQEEITPNIMEEEDLYKLPTDKLTFVFSKKGAFITQVIDKYNDKKLSFTNLGRVPSWSSFDFSVSEILRGVVFEYKSPDAGLMIKKTYTIKSDYALDLVITISNVTNLISNDYDIFVGGFEPSKDPVVAQKNKVDERYHEAIAYVNGAVTRKNFAGLKKDIEIDGKILWLGIRDRYFCSVFSLQRNANKAVIKNLANGSGLSLRVVHSQEDASVGFEDQYMIFAGPQDERLLKDFRESTEYLVNYGTFDPISKLLLFLLNVAHNVTKNWGLAIILVTMIVFVLTFPLSLKSMTSMKKIQTLQPVVEQLKVKYKDNPQKMNMEVMELYKREKVNPLGGCLPMLLQIPVFFALYQVLMRLINLRGANFLWIKDLSEPDRLIVFNNPLPFIGNEINLLPILMAIGMFFQQKLSMSSAQNTSPQMAEQQKMMSIVMPIMFGVLFYKISSGLVLYWFFNSLLMMGFQWKISRKKI